MTGGDQTSKVKRLFDVDSTNISYCRDTYGIIQPISTLQATAEKSYIFDIQLQHLSS